MYELKNGSARLTGALERCKEDPVRMKVLAQILYYEDEQLGQDIQALADYYEKSRKRNAPDRNRGLR